MIPKTFFKCVFTWCKVTVWFIYSDVTVKAGLINYAFCLVGGKYFIAAVAVGPVWKLVSTWPKMFLCYPFEKLVLLISLYSEFLKKKQRNKKIWFSVNSRFFCFAFHANLMSDEKKKRLKFLFMTPLILLMSMSINMLTNFFCTYYFLPSDTKIMDSVIQFALWKVKSKF